jgi:hypothetical protein
MESRPDSARAAVEPLLGRIDRFDGDVRLVRVLAATGFAAQADRLLPAGATAATPSARARRAHAEALVRLAQGDSAAAETGLRAALAHDPYTTGARLDLVALLSARSRPADALAIIDEAAALALPSGPDFRRRAQAAVR